MLLEVALTIGYMFWKIEYTLPVKTKKVKKVLKILIPFVSKVELDQKFPKNPDQNICAVNLASSCRGAY